MVRCIPLHVSLTNPCACMILFGSSNPIFPLGPCHCCCDLSVLSATQMRHTGRRPQSFSVNLVRCQPLQHLAIALLWCTVVDRQCTLHMSVLVCVRKAHPSARAASHFDMHKRLALVNSRGLSWLACIDAYSPARSPVCVRSL